MHLNEYQPTSLPVNRDLTKIQRHRLEALALHRSSQRQRWARLLKGLASIIAIR